MAKESLSSNHLMDVEIKLKLRNQELFIDFQDLSSDCKLNSYDFKIYDLNGRIFEQFKLTNVPGVHILNGILPTGIYMVSIIDSENRSQFIKLHNSN